MIEKVLAIAKSDDRVRIVAMNGSRTNRNAPRDAFQDYDIVFLVTDMASFLADESWVEVFGKRIMMQTPENMTLFPPELGGRFTYLMLFEDGTRLDLMLIPIEEKERYCVEDSLTVILLDKDGTLPALPPPTDRDYWVKKPTAPMFHDCCNEFWWLATYVAKGLARNEILYALDHLASCREMVRLMMVWHVGIETNFSCSVGKNDKYLARYTSIDWWTRLMVTYQASEQTKQALATMMTLFEEVARSVADALTFYYDADEATRVHQYVIAVIHD